MRFRYTVISNDTTSFTFGWIFRDDQPSTIILTRIDLEDSLEVGLSTGSHMVGTNSGMSKYNSPWYNISVGDVLGNPIVYSTDPRYTSYLQPPTSPNQIVWGGFLLMTPSVSVPTTNGVILNVEMVFRTRFYGLRTLITRIENKEENQIKELEEKIKNLENIISKLILSSEEESDSSVLNLEKSYDDKDTDVTNDT